ncbi:PH domain-containing protein [Antrihabitans stalactiti]
MSSPHKSVPPDQSSHTEKGERTDGASRQPIRHVIRIQRLALLAAFMLLVCVSFPALSWPAVLGWLFLLPIAVVVWVLRTQTTVSAEGLALQTVFGFRTLQWSDIKGVRIPKRGWVRADLVRGGEVALPAVGFDRLQELAAASGGHIPDPFGPGTEENDSPDDGHET